VSVYVVDASVAAKWYLEEEHTEAALCVLNNGNSLHAPDFLLLEMDSVLWKNIRCGNIAGSDGDDIRAALRACSIQYHRFDVLRDQAYSIARRTGCTVYDCLYVALAADLGEKLVTADRRLCGRLAGGPFTDHVLWVEDIGREETPARVRDARGRRRRRR
jgi:predicted nucleic acid-binding protein